MTFLETWSTYLLHDLPWDKTREHSHLRHHFEGLWGDLRPGCLYFMRFMEGQHTWERILEAQKHLLSYGKRAQEVQFHSTTRTLMSYGRLLFVVVLC